MVLCACAFVPSSVHMHAHTAYMQVYLLACFFSHAKVKELKLTVGHGEYGEKRGIGQTS